MKDAPTPRPNKRPRLGPSPAEAVPRVKEEVLKAKGSKPDGDSRFEEFAKAIRPRTQKGPSWANEDSVPSASSSKAPSKVSKPKSNLQPENPPVEPAGDEPNPEGLSDLDWLKRHTKSLQDDAVGQPEQLYEQSDEEAAEEDVTKVFVSSSHISHS